MRPWLRWLATSRSASLTHGRNDAMIKVAGFKAGSIIDSSTGYYPGVPGYGGETWLRIWILALCLERRVKLLSGSA